MLPKSTLIAASFAMFCFASLAAPAARAEEPHDASASAEEHSVPAAASPSAHMHDGFYFRDAVGFGYGSFSASGPAGQTHLTSNPIPLLPATNGLLLFGGTPFRGFVIGGGASAMEVKGDLRDGPLAGPTSGSQLTVGPFVDWYPDPSKGFHVGALVGPSGALIDTLHPQMSLSMGGTIFGGWDFWIGSQTSLGVMSIFSATTPSSLVDSSGHDTGYRIAPLSASLAITLVVH